MCVRCQSATTGPSCNSGGSGWSCTAAGDYTELSATEVRAAHFQNKFSQTHETHSLSKRLGQFFFCFFFYSFNQFNIIYLFIQHSRDANALMLYLVVVSTPF